MMGWAVTGVDNHPAPFDSSWYQEHDRQIDIPPIPGPTDRNEIAKAMAERWAG